MAVVYFMSNRDLAGFLVSLAAQSTLISLFGIAFIVSAGFRLSGISWSTTTLPVVNAVEFNT